MKNYVDSWLHHLLDLGEEIGHDTIEQFQIIHQELGNVDITDGT